MKPLTSVNPFMSGLGAAAILHVGATSRAISPTLLDTDTTSPSPPSDDPEPDDPESVVPFPEAGAGAGEAAGAHMPLEVVHSLTSFAPLPVVQEAPSGAVYVLSNTQFNAPLHGFDDCGGSQALHALHEPPQASVVAAGVGLGAGSLGAGSGEGFGAGSPAPVEVPLPVLVSVSAASVLSASLAPPSVLLPADACSASFR